MRFKYDSYEKLFPRQEIRQPEQYETAVESFTPSKEVTQDASADPTPAPAPQPIPDPIAPPIAPQPEPIRGAVENGSTDNN